MAKNKFIIIALLILTASLVAALLSTGCTAGTTTTPTPSRSYNVVKTSNIVDAEGTQWQIYQLTFTLGGGANFTIDLNLTDGSEVDCWYNTEHPTTGGSVGFQVKAGNAVYYPENAAVSPVASTTSDRFSFTTTEVYGTSYRLIFHNNLAQINANETIYAELMFPVNASGEDSIFVPLGTN